MQFICLPPPKKKIMTSYIWVVPIIQSRPFSFDPTILSSFPPSANIHTPARNQMEQRSFLLDWYPSSVYLIQGKSSMVRRWYLCCCREESLSYRLFQEAWRDPGRLGAKIVGIRMIRRRRRRRRHWGWSGPDSGPSGLMSSAFYSSPMDSSWGCRCTSSQGMGRWYSSYRRHSNHWLWLIWRTGKIRPLFFCLGISLGKNRVTRLWGPIRIASLRYLLFGWGRDSNEVFLKKNSLTWWADKTIRTTSV